MKANTEWLDTIGAYARSVEDIALFRAALMAMPYLPIQKLDKPPRIAVCFTHHKSELSPEGLAAVQDAAVQLGKAGAAISELELPAPVSDMTEGQRTLSAFDGPRAHADEARRFPHLLSESLKKDKLAAGAKIDYATWVAARKLGETGRARVDALFADFDAILTAPAPGEAPLGLSMTGKATFNLLWTYLWMPCVTLPFTKGPNRPAGRHPAGRPSARGRGPAGHRRLGAECAHMKPLSASEAVAKIEAGTLTSEALVRACLERIAEREPTVRAWAYLDPDLALAQAKAADVSERRHAARRADRREGHHRHPRHADRPQLADLQGQGAVRRCRLRGALPDRQRGDPGQDGDHGIRQPPSRPDDQPAQRRAHAGRLVVGLGRRGGRRPGAAGLRHPDRRLGDPSRRLLRRDRLQAHLRRLLAGRHQDAMPFGRYAGPDGAHARRHRAVSRRRAQAAAGPRRPRHRAAAHRLPAARRSGTRPRRTPRRSWKSRRPGSPTRARR